MSKRVAKKGAPGLWRRGRNLVGSFTAVAVAVVLVSLVWSTLQTQRLVGLRQQAVELEQRVEAEAALRDAALAALLVERSYETVAARARVELGMVDSDPGSRTFVALPQDHSDEDPALTERLARQLDRFSRVRAAFASEETR